MFGDSFWHFSCSAYEGKEAEFLHLQDEGGLNVNMLLLCGWLGRCGFAIGNIEALVSVCDEWDIIFRDLRGLRKAMKDRDLVLYESCKALELQFEKSFQASLLSVLQKSAGGSVSSNIEHYLRFMAKAGKSCWSVSKIDIIVSHLQEVIFDGSP